MPYLHLLLEVYAEHGRTDQKEAILIVEELK